MPRAAGDGAYYVFRLYNQGTGRYDHSREIRLASVTTVIKATLASPALVGWAERETRGMVSGLVSVLRHMDLTTLMREDGLVNPDMHVTVADLLEDEEILKELMVSNGLTTDAIKEEAGESGKENHAALERLALACIEVDEERADELAERMLSSRNGWERAIGAWWLERKPIVVATETMLYSLRHGYAGSLDLCTWDKDTLEYGIVDLKCRGEDRVAYESDHVQVGAYALAWDEMFGIPVAQRSVLIARSDGTYTEYPSYTDPEDFLHLLHVWTDIKRAELRARLDRKAKREVT